LRIAATHLFIKKEVIPAGYLTYHQFLTLSKRKSRKEGDRSRHTTRLCQDLKTFCEVTDIVIPWNKITRELSKGRRYTDDRAPTLEEIKKLCGYPDRRIKAIVYTMMSSGIRVGAWYYLKWGNFRPITGRAKKRGK
jgi:hypothetical protein